MSKLFACTVALLCSAPVWAQQQVIGTATDVQGLVTISQGSTLTTAIPGSKVMESAQVVTGSGSSVTLKLNDGCELHMHPNQSLVVTKQKTCDALLALLQGPGTLALLPSSGIGVSTVAMGAITGLGVLDASRSHGETPIVFPPVSHQ